MCWPANTAGAFFLALIVFDMVQEDWIDLPYHGVIGVIVVGVLLLICNFLSVSLAAGVLVVPTIFLVVFLFTIWLTGESLKKQGCCMKCGSNTCSNSIPHEQEAAACPPAPAPSPTKCVPQSLKATPVV